MQSPPATAGGDYLITNEPEKKIMSIFNEKAFWITKNGELKVYTGYDAEVILGVRAKPIEERLSIINVPLDELQKFLDSKKLEVIDCCACILKKPWYSRITGERFLLKNESLELGISYQQILNKVKRGGFTIPEMYNIMHEFFNENSDWEEKYSTWPTMENLKTQLGL
jgi:hypothetical protein